jgi:hypothetical protein
LKENGEKVFDAWYASLKKGNKGIFWRGGQEIDGVPYVIEAFGLRTTTGTSPLFYFNTKNPKQDRITSYVFARIQPNHDGSCSVECLGWGYRHKIGPWLRNNGRGLTANIETLAREGVLRHLAVLRGSANE